MLPVYHFPTHSVHRTSLQLLRKSGNKSKASTTQSKSTAAIPQTWYLTNVSSMGSTTNGCYIASAELCRLGRKVV